MPRGIPNKSAVDNPVLRTSESPNIAEMAGPTVEDYTLPAKSDIIADEIPEVEPVTGVQVKTKWMEDMAWLETKVEIILSESNDPNDEPRVPLCVNGEKTHPVYGNHLPRGVQMFIKRKAVEVLARAKPIRVTTAKTIDHDGNDTSKIVRTVGVKYPFSLLNPTPEDNAWLQSVRGQA